jgi:hypothetical protein
VACPDSYDQRPLAEHVHGQAREDEEVTHSRTLSPGSSRRRRTADVARRVAVGCPFPGCADGLTAWRRYQGRATPVATRSPYGRPLAPPPFR